MGKIEQLKSYSGKELDNLFFRPMFVGQDANDLGIKVMYNTPVPTVLHFWRQSGDILQKYSMRGWDGGTTSEKLQKTISLSKVKAEAGYSAEDYFSTVYEYMTARPEVNLGDLSGTELEEAETILFREAIAESIRATMWYGSMERELELNTFTGFLHHILYDEDGTKRDINSFIFSTDEVNWAEKLLKDLWNDSTDDLKALKSEGNLVFLVSSDVYAAYEESLDSVQLDAAYQTKQNGRDSLFFRGIPVVDLKLNQYKAVAFDMPHSFAMLTDRRNLALAVNTNDFPGTEVRMWYNPDEMENRQRAVFMAGCTFLMPELVTFAMKERFNIISSTITATNVEVKAKLDIDNELAVVDFYLELYSANDVVLGDKRPFTYANGIHTATATGSNISYAIFTTKYIGEIYRTVKIKI